MAKRVLVIGGGPAGLVTLKTLLGFENQFDPILLEGGDSIGGTFAQRGYEGAHLVSSKQLTSFSDFRFPREQEDHPSLPVYVQYLKDYCHHFRLDEKVGEEWAGKVTSRISLGCRVVKMERFGIQHAVTFSRKDLNGELVHHTVVVDAVAICSGLHVSPAVPHIEGMLENLVPQAIPVLTPEGLPISPPGMKTLEKEGVRIIHSSQYKNTSEFKGRKVMILGCGETSMDLSYAAIKNGASEVTLCHRGGFLSFPKVLNDFSIFGIKFDGNLPIDGLITNLFETSYVHDWVSKSHIRWFISDFGVKRVLKFMTGTSEGCNQWVGGLPPSRLGRAYVFLNKSTKPMPYINRPYKKDRILSRVFGTHYVDPKEDAESDKVIDLALFPSHCDETGRVHFLPASAIPQSAGMIRPEEARMALKEVRPDFVIYCTGYKTEFPWLDPSYIRSANVDTRSICDSSDVSVGYLGLVRPGVGAIPPIAEIQSHLWSLLLLQQIPIPTSPPHYELLVSSTARIRHGVDHGGYTSTLAKDIGSSPNLLELYQKFGLHVTICYCFGAAFVPFYRLTGPFASEEMIPIIKGELWDTICRRGVGGNLFMGLIPMIFYGILNLLAYILENTWNRGLKPVLSSFGLKFEGDLVTKKLD